MLLAEKKNHQTTATFKLLSVEKDAFQSRCCIHQQEANWAKPAKP